MNYLERNRDFKGVWIPKDIWLNDSLTMLEKVILIEIDSLDNEQNCVAGNDYLAQFCQCSEWKVSTAIKKLQELGYIEIISFDGRHRRIRSLLNQPPKNPKADSGNSKDSLLENQEQTLENPKADSGKPKAINIANNLASNLANNDYCGETSSSTTNNQSSANNFSAEIKEIVDYLNVKTHSRYRANTPNTQKHIVARLKQEYTVDDFKYVIDVKCAEWLGTEWEKFLRPDTLFGSKFENYLNTKMPVKKSSSHLTLDKNKNPAQPNAQGSKPKLNPNVVF